MYDSSYITLDALQSDNFNGVFMASAQIIDYYHFRRLNGEPILRTRETIQLLPYSIYLRRQSCLTHPINLQIALLSSNGLIANWDSKYRANNFLKSKSNDNREPKRLVIDQISGVIIICMVLYAIGVIIFILELMSTRHETIKIVMDFFASGEQKMS